MSTNYYTVKRCAGGWCFALCIHPDEGIRSLDDWRKRLESLPEGVSIVDEYDRPVTTEEMLKEITDRYWPMRGFACTGREGVSGPNGLRRAKIDGERCIGHGEGTWDLHVGDFS